LEGGEITRGEKKREKERVRVCVAKETRRYRGGCRIDAVLDIV
jgi:hypothetical protein